MTKQTTIVVIGSLRVNERYVVETGFELATPGSAIRHITDCAMEPAFCFFLMYMLFYLPYVLIVI